MRPFTAEQMIDHPYSAYSYEPDFIISRKDASFLAAAAKLAQTSDNRFRMACIAVRSGSVLGTDINVTKTHPTTPPNRFSTHAEIGAMKACSDSSGTTLYIARLKVDGFTALARPCSWCMQQIQNNEVYRVVYTTDFDMPESFYISTIDWNSSVLEA